MQISDIQEFRKSLRVLEREIGMQMEAETSCCGVTLAQCHVLMELDEKGKSSIKDLASLMDLDKSTLSRTVEQLVQLGLAVRTEDPSDRRFSSIELLEAGRNAVQNINHTCNQFYGELFRYIPQVSQRQVFESVIMLAGAMRELRKSAVPEIRDCCKPKGGI